MTDATEVPRVPLLAAVALLLWMARTPRSPRLWIEALIFAAASVYVLVRGVESVVWFSYIAVVFAVSGAMTGDNPRTLKALLLVGALTLLVMLVDPAATSPWRWIATVVACALAVPLIRRLAQRHRTTT